jgi:hypothetical protein
MPGDGDAFELELVEDRDKVALVICVAVGVAVLAEAVPAEVERDDPDAGEPRPDAQPVAEMAGQPVQEDDRWAVSFVDVGEAVRAAILRPRLGENAAIAPTPSAIARSRRPAG